MAHHRSAMSASMQPLIIVLLAPLTCLAACGNRPIASTPLGQVLGSTLTTLDGKNFSAFRGIRYAKAPVADFRFKPPSPVDAWDGILNATVDGPWCPQAEKPNGSEDCLFLNVYTSQLPDKRDSPKKPVLIFFHPGAFYSMRATSDLFGPEYLMDEDIVLLTANYRLGALGFLSTGDSIMPGNYGLKDQVEVLRWVQKNIAAFGGDPENVTICGYSAGSYSVLLHMLSTMSKGLFHRAIAMSGGVQSVVLHDPLGQAKKQAQLLNCPDNSSKEIYNCLKEKDAQEIADSITGFYEFVYDPILIYKATIEKDYGNGAERFLTEDPTKQFLSGNFTHVPLMTGSTKDDFSWKALQVLANDSAAEEMTEHYEKIYPISFLYERNTESSHTISKNLRSFYLHDHPIANKTRNELGELYADSITIFPVHRSARILSKINTFPVYYYQFTYQGRYSWVDAPGTTTPYGVVHHDDLIYLFYISTLFPFFNKDDPEYVTVKRMTKMWSNFAKSGNPTSEKDDTVTVDWKPLTASQKQYMEIGSQLTMKKGLYYYDRMSEWSKLFPLPCVSAHK
ncbi:juvenile hormone esterase-like [Schistocerca nitens]|uniref:juvenile hormone esterase-like n=1 Tax=Schistocerca nitens TaxID=7011 RepID=UPI0021193DD0|nr:juvenile hormone esterase-like [Schistocerca nitens]